MARPLLLHRESQSREGDVPGHSSHPRLQVRAALAHPGAASVLSTGIRIGFSIGIGIGIRISITITIGTGINIDISIGICIGIGSIKIRTSGVHSFLLLVKYWSCQKLSQPLLHGDSLLGPDQEVELLDRGAPQQLLH